MGTIPDPDKITRFLNNKGNYSEAEEVHAFFQYTPEALDGIFLTEDLAVREFIHVSGRIKRLKLRRMFGRRIIKVTEKQWWVAASVISILGFTIFLLLNKR